MNRLARPLPPRSHTATRRPATCAAGASADAGLPGDAAPCRVSGVHSVATPAVLAGLALMLLLLSGCGGGSDAASEQGSPAGSASTSSSTGTTGANTATGNAATAATSSTTTSTSNSASPATAATTTTAASTAGSTSVSGSGAAATAGGTPVNAAPVIGTTALGATTSPAATSGSGGNGASSQPPLADCGLNDSVDVILSRINALRARGASCGARGSFAPAPALVWNTRLHAAAAGHTVDMAAHNYFAHTSPSGQTLVDRVAAVDYSYRLVAENIAAGQTSLDSVLASWMASDGHCANLMHPQMREAGLACSAVNGARYSSYWTLNLGAAP